MVEIKKGERKVILIGCNNSVYAGVWYDKRGTPSVKHAGTGAVTLGTNIRICAIYAQGFVTITEDGEQEGSYGTVGKTMIASVAIDKEKIYVSTFSKTTAEKMDVDTASKRLNYIFN